MNSAQAVADIQTDEGFFEPAWAALESHGAPAPRLAFYVGAITVLSSVVRTYADAETDKKRTEELLVLFARLNEELKDFGLVMAEEPASQ